MNTIHHALVLNLHQPSGNLEYLLDNNEWEAKEILFAIDRMPRLLWSYDDIARIHLSLSGILLETLSHPDFQSRVYGIVKCGELLWHLQNTKIFEILGTGYYHPVLPLIPKADWDEHLQRWRAVAQHIFYRTYFPGFWPPEMGFCMELIPHLVRSGYRYVLVDSEHIEPLQPMRWEEMRYRPHIARYDGHEITIVVRDRQLSDAQESGMEFDWFERELYERTKWCDFPPLVTTCTDGENGGWFRNTTHGSNFWSAFYLPFLERVRHAETMIRPTFIDDYLDNYPAQTLVKVRTAAWNTGWHHGVDFIQWTGSQTQKEAFHRVAETSRTFHDLQQKAMSLAVSDPAVQQPLTEAHWHILRAETSCYFYWGESWVHRVHEDLDSAWSYLNVAEIALRPYTISAPFTGFKAVD